MPETQVIYCGQCDLAIDDSVSDSISCDICEQWVHAHEKCSKLKKTAFKKMKNVDWVCPNCIDFGKKCRNQNQASLDVGLSQLQSELKEVRDLNHILFSENKTLTAKIHNLNKVIVNLNRSIKKSIKKNPTQVTGSPRSGLRPSLDRETNLSQVSNSDINVSVNLSDSICLNDSKISYVHEPVSEVLEPNRANHEVRLFADSHGRGLQRLMQPKCNHDKIQVNFFPSAPTLYYAKNLVLDSNGCTSKPSASNVLMLGVNDTSDVSVDSTVELLENNVNKLKNLAIVEAPYRYDKPHLNKFIKKQNDRFRDLCNKLKWRFVPLNFALCRVHYTRQGLHLNGKGKNVISCLISDVVSNFLVV